MDGADGTGRWGEVSSAILLGLAHELNNRVLALMGVRELAEDGTDGELLSLFGEELGRLERVAAQLRLLGEAPGGEEVVEARALLDSVRALNERNASLRGVASDWVLASALPAVRVDPSAALRALLTILHAAGAAAREAGGALTVSARGSDGTVLVEVRPAPERADLEPFRRLGMDAETTAGGATLRFTPV